MSRLTSPQITLDHNVMPGSVLEQSNSSLGLRSKGALLAVSVIAILTLLLGIMAALHLVRLRDDAAIAGTEQKPEAADPEQEVTRGLAPDLITSAGAVSRIELSPLKMNEVLVGLSPGQTTDDLTAMDQAEDTEQDILSRNKLRMLREGVLAGIYSVKVIERNGRQRLCLRMPNANVSQDEAADLIREAAARDEIELSEYLSTEDGDFDADTLIFNLVQTSLMQDGTKEGVAAAREMSRRAFAASQAKTTQVKGERTYVVKPGDSLAYISLQFYGRPSAYDRIFRANRSLLKTPDRIQIGQRLIIPT